MDLSDAEGLRRAVLRRITALADHIGFHRFAAQFHEFGQRLAQRGFSDRVETFGSGSRFNAAARVFVDNGAFPRFEIENFRQAAVDVGDIADMRHLMFARAQPAVVAAIGGRYSFCGGGFVFRDGRFKDFLQMRALGGRDIQLRLAFFGMYT